MVTNRVDQLFAAFLIFLGCYIVWTGLDYGYMKGTTPGSGFFPVIVGGVIVVLSVVNLLRSLAGAETFKDSMKLPEMVKISGITLGLLAVIFLTPYLGLALSVSLLMLVVGFTIKPSLERGFLLRLLPTCVLLPVFLKLCFGNLLGVPVPVGIFGY